MPYFFANFLGLTVHFKGLSAFHPIHPVVGFLYVVKNLEGTAPFIIARRMPYISIPSSNSPVYNFHKTFALRNFQHVVM